MKKIEGEWTDFELKLLIFSYSEDKETNDKIWKLKNDEHRNIELKINGIEVDFRAAMKELESQFNGIINEEAKKLAWRKMQDIAIRLKLVEERDMDIMWKDYNE